MYRSPDDVSKSLSQDPRSKAQNGGKIVEGGKGHEDILKARCANRSERTALSE
jgi:hypothetical protein